MVQGLHRVYNNQNLIQSIACSSNLPQLSLTLSLIQSVYRYFSLHSKIANQHLKAIQQLKANQIHFTMDSQEIAIESFISYIKNISLHFENIFAPNQADLRGITHKTFKLITDFEKYVADYNQKVLKQIENAKITVPLIFYRSIKDNINDPAFMQYKYKDYEMKFIFIRINLECHTHVEIVKNTNGVKKTSTALQRLENGFVYMIYKKLTQGYNPQIVSIKFFEVNALSYLEQVYHLMNGDIVCLKCRKTFSYHNQLKILLPPTIRLQNLSKNEEIEPQSNKTKPPNKQNDLVVQHVDVKNPPKYSHEACV